jgi:hypothetical protein
MYMYMLTYILYIHIHILGFSLQRAWMKRQGGENGSKGCPRIREKPLIRK